MVRDISRWKVYMNKSISESFIASYDSNKGESKLRFDKGLFYSFLFEVKKLLVLDFINNDFTSEDVDELVKKIEHKLAMILEDSASDDIANKVKFFMNSLLDIRNLLLGSAEAILEGDPASDSIQEVIYCYPGFYAISNYRIAHLFYQMNLKFLARLITEDAHRSTGIDINPGAQIGKRFFIDHGTGIVIGETCIIGDNVKLYQSVTLGALSLKKGNRLKGQKRHPTIEDNCTIYSSAAIFGGDTIIGEDSTIGANVFLTHSVPKHSLVYLTKTDITIVPKDETR